MKKITTILTLMTCFFVSSFGQDAGLSIDMDNSPIIFSNASLGYNLNASNTRAFSVEMWIKPVDVASNQKLISNIGNDFKNGYILGIENGELVFEVFDNQGTKELLTGGSLKAGVWQHVAAVFGYGEQELVVNGELVAINRYEENESFYNTTIDLVIGIASWDKVSFGYKGEMDEIRVWGSSRSEYAINNWMSRDLYQLEKFGPRGLWGLGLYLRCDETSGDSLVDSSPDKTPAGTIDTRFRKNSTIPFQKNTLFDNEYAYYGGIWEGHDQFFYDGMNLIGENLTNDQYAILEYNEYEEFDDFCNTPKPANIADISCERWHIKSSGNATMTLQFDSDFNMFGFADFVILESEFEDDFSNARIITGSGTGGRFERKGHQVPGGSRYYAVGFVTEALGVDKLAKSNSLNVYPNPSTGKITVETKDAKLAAQSITVLDATGQEVLSTDFVAGSQSIDLSNQAKGVYFIRIATENGNYSKRVTVF